MPMSPNIDDRPTCSKCNVEMLRGIAEPIVPGYERRNFECPGCGNKLKLVGYESPIKTMSKNLNDDGCYAGPRMFNEFDE